jgi:hypothetical protein
VLVVAISFVKMNIVIMIGQLVYGENVFGGLYGWLWLGLLVYRPKANGAGVGPGRPSVIRNVCPSFSQPSNVRYEYLTFLNTSIDQISDMDI